MASTSKERKVPPLPPGWSQHESKSHPGVVYYWNKDTGARTWDLKDIVSSGDLPVTSAAGTAPDINTLSVEQLEKLLEVKKRQEAGGQSSSSPSKSKRKSSENDCISHSKRKKIVFDLPKRDLQTLPKPSIKNERLSDSSEPRCKSKDQSSDKSTERSVDSEGSLVLDEDEKEELRKIKKKHKSPPKPKRKPKIEPKSQPTSSPKVKPEEKYFSENIFSPPKSSTHSPKSEEAVNYRYTYPANINNEPVYQKQSFDTTNFGTQHVLKYYENVKKPSYNSGRERGRRQGKPSVAQPTDTKTESPAPRHLFLPAVAAVDVTPDNEVDITPVYGSFDEDDFDHQSGAVQQQQQAPVPPQPPPQPQLPDPGPFHPTAPVPTEKEDSFNDVSYEGERPPTPPLLLELQEEESMEWEQSDMEEVLRETLKVRDIVSQAMDCQEDEAGASECTDHEMGVAVTRCMAVIDTNLLVSGLGVVAGLQEAREVVVVIPWQVVQELDGLKNSDNHKTAVGARAAVRWLHNLLLARPANLVTETAGQSRRAAARFQSKSPDDRILATCLQFKEEGHKVVLATNDINLSNKALINQLLSGNSETIFDVISKKDEDQALEERLHAPEWAGTDADVPKLKDLVEQSKECLRDLLEGVLKKEFIEAYGENLWEKIVSIKPKPSRPHWNLVQLFTLYSKHHIAVFGQSFPKNGNELKMRLNSVKDFLSSLKTTIRMAEIKTLFNEMEKLVETIREKDDYNGLVSICSEKIEGNISQLTDIEHQIKAASKNIVDDEDISSDNDDGNAMTLFQNVWEIIAAFTRGFASICNVECSIPPFPPNIEFKSLEEASKDLPGFFSSVSSLQEAMVRAVTVRTEAALYTFHGLLVSFRGGLELNHSFWPQQVLVNTYIEDCRNIILFAGFCEQAAAGLLHAEG